MASPLPVNVDPFGRRTGEPRKEVVAGAVTMAEKAEIQTALGRAGFANQSDGVRTLCLAFLASAAVRDAIEAYRTAQTDAPSDMSSGTEAGK